MSPTFDANYSLADLCVLADTPPRTVRYYVQIGLVDRPQGETRAARYDARHLAQLLQVRKWSAAGIALERIRELLHGEAPPVPPRNRLAGSVEVRTHLIVSDGVELSIEPGRAGLTPSQVRAFTRAVMLAYETVTGNEQAAPDSPPESQENT